tara:strand:- start:74 stop:532 length:459 start_codon:yes stop_codon:yes gene_type:complete
MLEKGKKMEETKKGIGKLYEKFEIIKKHTHNLEVAIAQNHLTSQEEIIIVWSDPNDDDRKMPLAQLLTGTEIQEYLEPDFLKSIVIDELFKGYSKYDVRQSVEELDDVMAGDEDYSKMLSTFMEGVELAKALQKEDEIIENLEKMLKMEEEE